MHSSGGRKSALQPLPQLLRDQALGCHHDLLRVMVSATLWLLVVKGSHLASNALGPCISVPLLLSSLACIPQPMLPDARGGSVYSSGITYAVDSSTPTTGKESFSAICKPIQAFQFRLTSQHGHCFPQASKRSVHDPLGFLTGWSSLDPQRVPPNQRTPPYLILCSHPLDRTLRIQSRG